MLKRIVVGRAGPVVGKQKAKLVNVGVRRRVRTRAMSPRAKAAAILDAVSSSRAPTQGTNIAPQTKRAV